MKSLITLILLSSSLSYGALLETTYKVKSRLLTGTKSKRLPTFRMSTIHNSESSLFNLRAAKDCQLTIGGKFSLIMETEDDYKCVSTKREVVIDKKVIQSMLYKMSEFSLRAEKMYDLSDRILQRGSITSDQTDVGRFLNKLLAGVNKPYLLSTKKTTTFLMKDSLTGNQIKMTVEPIKSDIFDY